MCNAGAVNSAAFALRSVALETTFALLLDADDREVRITVEGDYDLARPHAPRLRTYAGDEDAIVGELTALIGQRLSQFGVAATGDLTLEWATSQGPFRLVVPPAVTLTAWQIEWGGPDSQVTRCLPGGAVAGPLP